MRKKAFARTMRYRLALSAIIVILWAGKGWPQSPSKSELKGIYSYQSGEAARTIKRGDQELHLPPLVYASVRLELKSFGRASLRERRSMAGTEFEHKLSWELRGDSLFLRHKGTELPSDTLFFNEHGNLVDRYGKVRYFREREK